MTAAVAPPAVSVLRAEVVPAVGGDTTWTARHRPAVLLVTHDVDEAVQLADRVLVLDRGRIALDLAIDRAIDGAQPRSHLDPDVLAHREHLLTALGVHR